MICQCESKRKKKLQQQKKAKTTRVGNESAQAYGRTDTVIPIYLPELCSWGYKPSLIVFLVLVLSHLTNKPLVLTLSVLKVTLIGFFLSFIYSGKSSFSKEEMVSSCSILSF